MSESYSITIESVEARTVRASVLLLNFQYPEAPVNKCFALQIVADALRALRAEETNKKKGEAKKLAAFADERAIAFAALLDAHDQASSERLIASAAAEIERVVEASHANFEKAAAWHEKNEAAAQDLPAFRTLALTQVLEFDVADERLLAHLEAGLRWTTWMSARDESY
jgi:hypothetical protein